MDAPRSPMNTCFSRLKVRQLLSLRSASELCVVRSEHDAGEGRFIALGVVGRYGELSEPRDVLVRLAVERFNKDIGRSGFGTLR